jgi:hypothetical protein
MKAFKAMFTTQEQKNLMLLNAIRLKYLFSITGDPNYAGHYKEYYDKYVTLYTPKECKDIPKQKITEEQKDIAKMLSRVTPEQQASLDDYIRQFISEDNAALRKRLYNFDTAAPPSHAVAASAPPMDKPFVSSASSHMDQPPPQPAYNVWKGASAPPMDEPPPPPEYNVWEGASASPDLQTFGYKYYGSSSSGNWGGPKTPAAAPQTFGYKYYGSSSSGNWEGRNAPPPSHAPPPPSYAPPPSLASAPPMDPPPPPIGPSAPPMDEPHAPPPSHAPPSWMGALPSGWRITTDPVTGKPLWIGPNNLTSYSPPSPSE